MQQKITPFLWFKQDAEKAVDFYVSVFKDSKILNTSYYPEAAEEASGKAAGTVMTVEFELFGQRFTAINGGEPFQLSEAVSFVISCKDQAEIDYYWEKLGEGGDEKAQICGWLKDKFGLSWQITPDFIGDVLSGSDRGKAERMMQEVMKMKKLDYAVLKNA